MDTHDPSPTGKTPPKAFITALLRNPIRAEILRLIEHNPGLNQAQLAKTLEVRLNSVRFHLERLERAGLVQTRPGSTGRETLCFTPENVHLWDNEGTRMLFGRGSPREVARFLASSPGAGVAETARSLGISIHTVRRHIRTLEAHDLVQRLRIDRDVLYHAEPELVSWFHVTGRALGELRQD